MKNAITAIIVDDEPIARKLLQVLINDYIPEVVIVDTCNDILSAVKSIKKNNPDLVFLDIEMPNDNGLEIFQFFTDDEINFHIIFTTAYHQYAIQAFKLSAVDYLLKPIDPKDLKNAVEKFINKEKVFRTKYNILQDNLQHSGKKKLVVSTTSFIRYIDVDSITYIQADGAYSKIIYGENESIYSSKSLKYYDEIFFKYPMFMRTHKSFLINLDKVKEYVRTDGGSIKMKNGDLVGISSDKVSDFLHLMANLKRE